MTDSPYSQPPATPYATPYARAGEPGAQDRTNVLAIVALIGAFVFPLAGIICGHIALGQIKRTGEKGHGLALAGTVLGYVFIALGVLAFVLTLALVAANAGSIQTS